MLGIGLVKLWINIHWAAICVSPILQCSISPLQVKTLNLGKGATQVNGGDEGYSNPLTNYIPLLQQEVEWLQHRRSGFSTPTSEFHLLLRVFDSSLYFSLTCGVTWNKHLTLINENLLISNVVYPSHEGKDINEPIWENALGTIKYRADKTFYLLLF